MLRRKDGSQDFASPTYSQITQNGVGNPTDSEFFLSLELLHFLTVAQSLELLVLIKTDSSSAWARYSSFSVSDSTLNYALHISGYDPESTAGDALSFHDSMQWSSPDMDNDITLI